MRGALLLGLVLVGCAGVVEPSMDASLPGDAGASDAGADTDAGVDGAGLPDAGVDDAGIPDAGAEDAGVPCGSASASWTCTADGARRERCAMSALESESCSRGCLRPPPGTEAQCLGTSYTVNCPGSYGTEKSTAGDYYVTAFGCWVDAQGTIHTDPGDNCIPSCLSQAKAAGLCDAADTGPQCEERLTWFTADGARFGCLARLRITNPANGKSVVAVALDYGPACSLERSVSFPILDASGRVDRYLFGSDQGAVDRALVHVVEVDTTTPLGPVP